MKKYETILGNIGRYVKLTEAEIKELELLLK